MLDLTFAEQVKIILSRKGMTIKELAETIEKTTGKKMSRQNLTQRLGRDNFQEQDMRMIAEILDCPFTLNILEDEESAEKSTCRGKKEEPGQEIHTAPYKPALAIEVEPAETATPGRDITIGELVEIHEELDALIQEEAEKTPQEEPSVEELLQEVEEMEAEDRKEQTEDSREEPEESEEAEEPGEEDKKPRGWMSYLQRKKKKSQPEPKEQDADQSESNVQDMREIYAEEEGGGEEFPEELMEEAAFEEEPMAEPVEEPAEELTQAPLEDPDEDRSLGEINPYTMREYDTNSVRVHPGRIGYVQVYDREDHAWTDMTEWAFLGYQERKKTLLGKDYEPPVYLD